MKRPPAHPPLTLEVLQAELLQYVGPGHRRRGDGLALSAADGVTFLCPKCYHTNAGPVGTHGITCWFVGKVPVMATPGPGRWTPAGAGLADLTFVPGEPPRAVSVDLRKGGGCQWHGYIRAGVAVSC